MCIRDSFPNDKLSVGRYIRFQTIISLILFSEQHYMGRFSERYVVPRSPNTRPLNQNNNADNIIKAEPRKLRSRKMTRKIKLNIYRSGSFEIIEFEKWISFCELLTRGNHDGSIVVGGLNSVSILKYYVNINTEGKKYLWKCMEQKCQFFSKMSY